MDQVFIDRDQSIDGFEGIRAQDILPKLAKYFGFKTFLAWGGIQRYFLAGIMAEIMMLRTMKVPLSLTSSNLKDLLIDVGYLKPTNMCATMVIDQSTTPESFRHWTPDFCIRRA
jgi:hypothetical protein